MSSLLTLKIEFDRDGATYMPGEEITGRVILELLKPKQAKALKMCIKGYAKVHWEEKSMSDDSTTDYRATEEYFYGEIILFGLLDGSSEVNLPIGKQTFPFIFQLPNNIPCSFENKIGYVRYTAKAIIDRPWRFNYECKTAFTVLNTLDLNSWPNECIGINDDVSSQFRKCIYFFKDGNITANIVVPYSGFVPGQSFEAKIVYDIQSFSVNITKITTYLEQEIIFHSETPCHRKNNITIVLGKNKNSGPFAKKGLTSLSLTVPPTPPSRLQFCRIIDIHYRLRITIGVSGWHRNLEKKYPLLIGTIPLCAQLPTKGDQSKSVNDLKTQGSVSSSPLASSEMYYADACPPPYPGKPIWSCVGNMPMKSIGFLLPDQPNTSMTNLDIPPPSYEESITRTNSIKEDNDSEYVLGTDTPFAPRYPVFNFPYPPLPPDQGK